MRQLSVWYWLGICAIALLFGGLVLASRFSTVKAAAPEPASPAADVANDDAATNRVVDELMQKIDKSAQEDDANRQAGKGQAGTHDTVQAQQLAQQQQQMQASQDYLMRLQASMRPAGQPDSYISESAKKSFVMSFREETPQQKADIGTAARPQVVVADGAPQKNEDSSGRFACGSQENYWTACIPEGSVIQAVTTNELKGEFTGPVIAKVSQSLIAKDMKTILIPAGTSVLGEAGRVEGQDQARLAIVFHRLILSDGAAYHPAGWSIQLDKLQGLSIDGSAGQEGRVNHHMTTAILAAGAYGVLAGFALSGTGSALTSGGIGVYRQGISEGLGMQGETMLGRYLNRLPDVTVPINSECDVYFSRDVMVR